MNTTTEQPVILLIDDEPENLTLLGDILHSEGLHIRAFLRGDHALRAAKEAPPDLVLLDINMPELDGYEVCRRFKADDTLRAIPIIFLSAFSETSDKITAFEAGGADYITKPFANAEVLARVRLHTHLYRRHVSLEYIIGQRVQELVEAHRRLRIWDDAKTDWINMLSHEMRTPLNGVLGVAELLLLETEQTGINNDLREAFYESRERILKLIDDANLLSEIDVAADHFCLMTMNICHCIRAALHLYETQSTAVKTSLVVSIPEATCVQGTPELLNRALLNLFTAATCYVNNDGCISVRAECREQNVRLLISTDDHQLSLAALDHFFEVGGQRTLAKSNGDMGLSAALARRIIRLVGGSVSVCNQQNNGIEIEINLPLDL
ncbi:MAG: hybrid sensor histidine kinase/response regulator [Verrucomicrobiota bacterium]